MAEESKGISFDDIERMRNAPNVQRLHFYTWLYQRTKISGEVVYNFFIKMGLTDQQIYETVCLLFPEKNKNSD